MLKSKRIYHGNSRYCVGKPWHNHLQSQAARVKVIPPEVLAERNAALSHNPDITALVCGDPLPGRSALDKRNHPHADHPPRP